MKDRIRVLRDESGFALIESAVTLLFISAALSGAMSLAYFATARMFLKRAAYEMSICLSTSATTDSCEVRFKKEIARILPIGTLEGVSPQTDENEVGVRFGWSLPIPGLSLKIEDHRTIPLIGDYEGLESRAEKLKKRFP